MTGHREQRVQKVQRMNDRVGGYWMLGILVTAALVLLWKSGNWAGFLWGAALTVAFVSTAAVYGLWHSRPGTPPERVPQHNPFSNDEGFGP